MKKKKLASLSLVIPVFNCEKTIVDQLKKCEKIIEEYSENYEILVSDDSSTDKTRELLEKNFANKKKFRLVFQKVNQGIGKNFKFLYQNASMDYILAFAPDGDYEPDDLSKMIKFCISENADLVIGKRIKKGGYTLYRKMISSLFRLLPLLFFGVDTVDAGSIKLIKKNVLQKRIISDSVFVEAEIIIKAKYAGYKIVSCPIYYGKPEKISGAAGKFNLAFEAFWDLLKVRFASISI